SSYRYRPIERIWVCWKVNRGVQHYRETLPHPHPIMTQWKTHLAG
ncbi:hypothetical protein ACVME5_009818, partial [Bradyrhizobium liaoningense]